MPDANLANKLSKKLGNTIPIMKLVDIIIIIENYLYDEMVNDRPVYIDKFGVFTQFVPISKKTWSRIQQKIVMSIPTKRLVFRVHETFKRLIELKKEYLKVPKIIK